MPYQNGQVWLIVAIIFVIVLVALVFNTIAAKEKNIRSGKPLYFGLDGWGYLLSLNVMSEPLRYLYSIYEVFQEAYNLSLFSRLAYDWDKTPVIFGHIVIFKWVLPSIITLLSCYLVYLFYKRKKSFVSFSVNAIIFSTVVWIIHSISQRIIFPSNTSSNLEFIFGIVGGVLGAWGYLSYLSRSKRVAVNFVN